MVEKNKTEKDYLSLLNEKNSLKIGRDRKGIGF
jgi:hypothetical protein